MQGALWFNTTQDANALISLTIFTLSCIFIFILKKYYGQIWQFKLIHFIPNCSNYQSKVKQDNDGNSSKLSKLTDFYPGKLKEKIVFKLDFSFVVFIYCYVLILLPNIFILVYLNYSIKVENYVFICSAIISIILMLSLIRTLEIKLIKKIRLKKDFIVSVFSLVTIIYLCNIWYLYTACSSLLNIGIFIYAGVIFMLIFICILCCAYLYYVKFGTNILYSFYFLLNLSLHIYTILIILLSPIFLPIKIYIVTLFIVSFLLIIFVIYHRINESDIWSNYFTEKKIRRVEPNKDINIYKNPSSFDFNEVFDDDMSDWEEIQFSILLTIVFCSYFGIVYLAHFHYYPFN